MRTRWILGAMVAFCLAHAPEARAATKVSAPMACSRGSDQPFEVITNAPETAVTGATLTIRLDGTPSGAVSHTGLNFIHDMVTDFIVPTGTWYVEGSVRIVPDTGTDNVRAGATVVQRGGGLRLTLPARVDNGTSYTPPSIEFKTVVTAAAGETLVLAFSQFRVTANAIVIGDVKVTCNPKPRPFPIGKTRVVAAPQ